MNDIGNPFLIFPEEIWDIILEHVEDSQDIINAILALPQLGILSVGKQCSWSFGAVIPLLFPKYIQYVSVKSCRLVSRRWRNAIDTTLERHSDRFPDKATVEKGVITETHFNYHKLPYICTDFEKYLCHYAGPYFEDEVESHHNNPFPGGSVHFYFKPNTNMEVSSHLYKVMRTSACLMALEINGHYIRHATLEGNAELRFLVRNVDQFYQFLCHLPNLNSLRLTEIIFDDKYLARFLDFMKTRTFPFNLETLDVMDLQGTSKHLLKQFVLTLVNPEHLKKVSAKSCHLDGDFGALLPTLCELSLDVNSIEELKVILQYVASPHLRKLRIKMGDINISDILEYPVLRQIECLEMCGTIGNTTKINTNSSVGAKQVRKSFRNFFSVRRSSNASVTEVDANINCSNLTIRPIRYLNLEVEVLGQPSFEFLKLLPVLQFLTIKILCWSPRSKCCKCSFRNDLGKDMFSECLNEFCCNVYHRGDIYEPGNFVRIWDEFPKLEMLTITTEQQRNYRYVRECRNNTFMF